MTDRATTGRVGALVVRWTVLTVLTVLAFRRTLVDIWVGASHGTSIGYLVVLPLSAMALVLGVRRRGNPVLPIHDRETDVIVGVIGLLIALAVQRLLLPRYAPFYELFHYDVLALVLFVLSGSVLLFGLRATARYRSVWVLLLVVNPVFYRLVAITLGGGMFAYTVVLIVATAACLSYGFLRGRRRVLGVAVLAIVLDSAVFALVSLWFPGIRISVVLSGVVPVTAVVVGGCALILREPLWPAATGPRVDIPTARPWYSVAALAAVAVVLTLTPLPKPESENIAAGPPYQGETGLVVPPGWRQTGLQKMDWPAHYFSSESTFLRQTVRTLRPNPQWDSIGRNRTAQIDLLTVRYGAALDVTPTLLSYDLRHSRVGNPPQPVPIGRGITADMYSIVDEQRHLTWNYLTFVWRRDTTHIQRVTVMTVDNHEPDAYFLPPRPTLAGLTTGTIALLARGVSALTDADPEYKDADLLATLARRLVQVQPW
ncbi:hypothetical protein [Nocardia sp. NPDC024068]|uniref:hypothetical protein n=1 Tax=Nocardia sp. NPDC024068 TaxID=3157197 RepID=UPI0033BFE719